MKLPVKLAGLCGSGVFIVTAIPGFYQQVKPTSYETLLQDVFHGMSVLETLGVSLVGAILAGMIGYHIGTILSNPKGPPASQDAARPAGSKKLESLATPITGEETFLDDLDAPTPENLADGNPEIEGGSPG